MDATVFLEIRRTTKSGLLIIRELKTENWPMDITVMPSSIEIKNGEDCKTISLPPEVRLVPSSCRGLQYVPGDGLHMRLLVQADFSTKLVSPATDSLRSKKSCTFSCQSCGESVIHDRAVNYSTEIYKSGISARLVFVTWRCCAFEFLCEDFFLYSLRQRITSPVRKASRSREFLRVLSLPSENWSDLVEEWCCHPNPFNSSMFHPQNEDCFLGHNYFLLNSGSVSTTAGSEILHAESHGTASESSGSVLNSKTKSRVICKRCKAVLGESLSSGVTKYYFTELFVQPSEDGYNMIPRYLFIQSVVAQCLVELSTARNTFRFSIQGIDGTVYILMWLLNSDMLLMESLGNLTSKNVFPLFDHGVSSDLRPVEITNTIKIVYHPCLKSRNQDLVDAWENDTGVHPLTFPSKTCLELLLILSQSNSSLPPSLRWMNAFQVAFLKM